ncbi:hypothetical protein HDU86_006337 [Geranomyces michiganensis]|nr:hypothetical protein HDU86_006337 [Geranomyces michiganensis]
MSTAATPLSRLVATASLNHPMSPLLARFRSRPVSVLASSLTSHVPALPALERTTRASVLSPIGTAAGAALGWLSAFADGDEMAQTAAEYLDLPVLWTADVAAPLVSRVHKAGSAVVKTPPHAQ